MPRLPARPPRRRGSCGSGRRRARSAWSPRRCRRGRGWGRRRRWRAGSGQPLRSGSIPRAAHSSPWMQAKTSTRPRDRGSPYWRSGSGGLPATGRRRRALDQVAGPARGPGEGEEARWPRRRGGLRSARQRCRRRTDSSGAVCSGDPARSRRAGIARRGGDRPQSQAQLQQSRGRRQPLAGPAASDCGGRDRADRCRGASRKGMAPCRRRRGRRPSARPGSSPPLIGSPASGRPPLLDGSVGSRREPAAARRRGPADRSRPERRSCVELTVVRPVVPQVELRAVRRDRLEGEVARAGSGSGSRAAAGAVRAGAGGEGRRRCRGSPASSWRWRVGRGVKLTRASVLPSAESPPALPS